MKVSAKRRSARMVPAMKDRMNRKRVRIRISKILTRQTKREHKKIKGASQVLHQR